ncbi:MAG: colanic acid biosynthesis acetyltransferase WcaF [Bryobacterales bacterium]|nr:colanic acid biosynthesis acetyltransferase WcaF [Bryobacterales bacterium]
MAEYSVRLDRFDNSWYGAGRSSLVCAVWFFFGLPVLRSSWMPFSSVRCRLLRAFGARVGEGVVIKPGVRVKYPWRLALGDHAWVGEDAWIDNLEQVTIGAHACLSQGVYLCTGNHDWSDPAFGLIVKPITIAPCAWVGARATVCPGVTVGEGAVVAVGGVAGKNVPAYEVHAGNPASFVRDRQVRGLPRRGQ